MPAIMTVQQRSDWLTAEATAKILGISTATVKRRLSDGKPLRLPSGETIELEAEMIERPQGHEWRVRLPSAQAPLNSAYERRDSEEHLPLISAQDRAETLSAALSVALGPLAEALALERTERQKLAQENADLRERAGRAESDARHAEARATHAEDELARLKQRSLWDWLRGR